MKIQAVLSGFVILLVLIGVYFFLAHRHTSDVSPDTVLTASSTEPVLSTATIAGEYDAQYGVGTIRVTFRDATHVVISGQTILSGQGNSADAQTIKEHTGKIDETVAIQDNEGILHPDSSDATCTLVVTFTSESLNIRGGYDSCDATIANFDGQYIKRTSP